MRSLIVAGVALLVVLYQIGSTTPGVAPDERRPAGSSQIAGDWQIDLLAALGNTQPTADTIAFLDAWQRAEGGSASFNWFNTTQDAPGATCYNADPCVKNYPDYQTGVQATIETLLSDHPGYAEIVAGLQTNDIERAFDGIQASPWGTHAGLIAEVYRERTPRDGPAGRVNAPAVGSKSVVTSTMQVGAHFDTADCGAWGFQVACQHWGTDFAGSEGDPVFAPYDLTVIALGEYGPGSTMGQYVQGTLPDGSVYYSGHLTGRPALDVGQTIPAGTQIGVMNGYAHTHVQLAPPGNTGACAQDGSCLDFETYYATH